MGALPKSLIEANDEGHDFLINCYPGVEQSLKVDDHLHVSKERISYHFVSPSKSFVSFPVFPPQPDTSICQC